MKFRNQLSQQEIRQHVDQSQALWGGGMTPLARFERWQRLLADAGPGTFHLSGLVDQTGTLLASLKRYYFSLRIDGKPVRTVGIGAVFTETAHRKQGLAKRLIHLSLESAKRDYECRLASLYCDIEPAYYEKQGFLRAPAEEFELPTAEIPQAAPLGLKAATGKDLPLVLGFYADQVREAGISTVRNERTWRFFHDVNRVQNDLVLRSEGKDLGFLSFTLNAEKKSLWLEEWCGPAELESRIWATVRELAETAGFGTVRGWALPQYRALPGGKTARAKAIPMVKALADEPTLKPESLSTAYFASPDHF